MAMNALLPRLLRRVAGIHILADETPAAAGSFFTPVLTNKRQLNLQIEAD